MYLYQYYILHPTTKCFAVGGPWFTAADPHYFAGGRVVMACVSHMSLVFPNVLLFSNLTTSGDYILYFECMLKFKLQDFSSFSKL
jgi:hypothetical protein